MDGGRYRQCVRWVSPRSCTCVSLMNKLVQVVGTRGVIFNVLVASCVVVRRRVLRVFRALVQKYRGISSIHFLVCFFLSLMSPVTTEFVFLSSVRRNNQCGIWMCWMTTYRNIDKSGLMSRYTHIRALHTITRIYFFIIVTKHSRKIPVSFFLWGCAAGDLAKIE